MLVRFAELGGGQGLLGDGPTERLLAETCRRFAARDSEGMLACYAEDWLLVDHRTLGWGEMRKHDLPQLFETIFAAGSDWWLEIDEVLACDDRVIALSITHHATNNDGGGAADIAWGVVMLVEDGLRSREFLYEHGDRQGMLARYAELGGSITVPWAGRRSGGTALARYSSLFSRWRPTPYGRSERSWRVMTGWSRSRSPSAEPRSSAAAGSKSPPAWWP
jgi:hypothetical protein